MEWLVLIFVDAFSGYREADSINCKFGLILELEMVKIFSEVEALLNFTIKWVHLFSNSSRK